jgi:hypothetical protein
MNHSPLKKTYTLVTLFLFVFLSLIILAEGKGKTYEDLEQELKNNALIASGSNALPQATQQQIQTH